MQILDTACRRVRLCGVNREKAGETLEIQLWGLHIHFWVFREDCLLGGESQHLPDSSQRNGAQPGSAAETVYYRDLLQRS